MTRVKGLWIPRCVIFFNGFIDGLMNNVHSNDDKNQVFYFEKKKKDFESYCAEMIKDLDDETKEIIVEGFKSILKYQDITEDINQVFNSNQCETLREKRVRNSKLNKLMNEHMSLRNYILSVYNDYREIQLRYSASVLSNLDKLEIFFQIYFKGVKLSHYQNDLAIPNINYTNLPVYIIYKKNHSNFDKSLSSMIKDFTGNEVEN